MRLIHSLSLAAAFALAACGNNADEELTDEALSAEEVGAAMNDNGTMLQPGEYTTSMELVSFEMPTASSIDMEALQAAFEEGAANQASFCATEAMDRESLISAMTDNSCDITRITAEGNDLDLAMTCDAEDGPQGRITLAGTMEETSADLEMQFSQPIEGIGDADVTARISARRTGDCS
ncbi:DUF3617 domain-containing protein [Aurantiacibacter gangjinensis]|uniref:Uncharacterized protein n=1 Tax=Aurantiacibacter gangjinensis TaxID=502682 RepID=A0A0G9MMZ0_9SPHN|nr:DUF3617 family protein [Aurantiacibacter gangjinensis]APE28161.1 hypothetical protein BMF35_a1332 [Aurantiacibacter gangjinensis]KLE32070.1 hypothetical protein AAW01_11685 [Aurantiacibacter gangjinensis]